MSTISKSWEVKLQIYCDNFYLFLLLGQITWIQARSGISGQCYWRNEAITPKLAKQNRAMSHLLHLWSGHAPRTSNDVNPSSWMKLRRYSNRRAWWLQHLSSSGMVHQWKSSWKQGSSLMDKIKMLYRNPRLISSKTEDFLMFLNETLAWCKSVYVASDLGSTEVGTSRDIIYSCYPWCLS